MLDFAGYNPRLAPARSRILNRPGRIVPKPFPPTGGTCGGCGLHLALLGGELTRSPAPYFLTPKP